jgi:methylated-DNA-[protein]-cysteine S-methyltransferase
MATLKHDTAKQDTTKHYVYKWVSSPVGRLKLVATNKALAGVLWEKERPGRVHLDTPTEGGNTHPVLVEAERQIEEYFGGHRQAFNLKLDLDGTDFQRAVWQALLTIPFGETRSYEQIAKQIGNPTAMRAVGAANGRNPISIIVPCHRVVGATGDLTGFAGGLYAKAYLLTLEARALGRTTSRLVLPVTGQAPAPATRRRVAQYS